MRTRSKLSILALFSCCAVASMGFANWVITQEGPVADSVTGGITADNVIVSNEYVYFLKDASTNTQLRINEGGFTDPDNETQTILTGSFTVTFEVNLKNYSNIFKSGATTEIVLKFTEPVSSNANIFYLPDSQVKIGVACEDNTGLIDSVIGARNSANYNYTYVTTLSMVGLSNVSENEKATFTLTYTFEFFNENAYANCMYNVFYPNGIKSDIQFAFEILIKD